MQTQSTWRGKTFQDLVAEAKGRVREISADELRNWLAASRELVILDVREPEDYASGAISGAINLPRGILEIEIDELVPNQDKLIVAYCGGGSRSALAVDTLQTMGYTNSVSLAKGYRGWNT